MSNIIHFCARCSRPVSPNTIYCSDCQTFLQSPMINTPRCSNCGVEKKINEKMLWNKKLKKVYCLNCLQTFRNELIKQGLNEAYVRKILRLDFVDF
ncbi:MAG: hypothetical protein ACFFD1_02295 [Candidatus Thorarchaeota archaeon]